MFHALALLALCRVVLSIRDTENLPVAGASLCVDGSLAAVSDSSGLVELPDPGTELLVSAVGYASWYGPVPSDGRIVLEPRPVPSGLVVNVSASRGGPGDSRTSTTLLDRGMMERLSVDGLRSLSGRSAGTHVREYGGAMPVLSLSIRGASAGQAGCLVDGHPLESCTDGLPAILPDASLFGSLEVARGGGSGFLRGSMAGSIRFVPESAEAPPRASLTVDDHGGLHAACARRIGPGRLAVSLRRTAADGGSRAHSGSLLWTGSTELARFGLLTSAAGGETESPDWSVPTDARRQVASLEGWAAWRRGTFGCSADLGLRGMTYESTTPSTARDEHREGGGSLTAEWFPDLGLLDLRVSGEISGRLARSTTVGERQSLSADLAASGTLEAPVTLDLSTRLSMTRDAGPLAGTSLTASSLLFGDALAVHLTGSLNFRRPTFNDLYWPEEAFAVGNPGLLPERSFETEAGFEMPGPGSFALSLTGFLAITDDLIRWEPGESGRWTPVNVARVRRRGIEAECRLSAGAVGIRGTLTLLEVSDADPSSTNYGRTLPYAPDCTFGLHADADLPGGFAAWTAVEGVGTRFLNYSATSWLPAYQLLSAGIAFPTPFWREGSFSLSGTNLLDCEYEESNGYRGETRRFRATLLWNGRRSAI